MSKINDQGYVSEQYHDASNLNARIELHARFSTNAYGWHPWVFDQFDRPAQCRILELGCGPGRLWSQNRQRIPTGWDITLSDFSPGMLDEARRNLSGLPPFRFETIDAQSIPFEAATFDAVIANHMLYHVPDRRRALAEMRRVLKPGGRLYAATNGHAHMRELDDLVRRVLPDWNAWDSLDPNFFTLERGRGELREWFAGVDVRRYEDALIVTEVEPLVAYVMSGARQSYVADRREEFARAVNAEFATRGAIRITKDAGLLIAARGEV